MVNLNKLDKEHKEIILNLRPEELIVYLRNISKRKIDSLGFIKVNDITDNIGSVEDYNKYSNIQEEIPLVFSENESDYINKEYKKVLASGLTVAIDYEELLAKYIEQVKEAKVLFFQKIAIETYYISEAIKFNVNHLNFTLGNYYLLLHNKTGTETGNSIELIFNGLIEDVYKELQQYINSLEKFKIFIEKLEKTSENVPEELEAVISTIVIYVNSALEYVEQLEELKANPFKEPSKFVAMDYIAKIFETDVPDLDSFKETLETEEDIAVFNCLVEGFTSDLASYDFKEFKIIEPERSC